MSREIPFIEVKKNLCELVTDAAVSSYVLGKIWDDYLDTVKEDTVARLAVENAVSFATQVLDSASFNARLALGFLGHCKSDSKINSDDLACQVNVE